jgi:ComF family protein
VMTGAFLLLFFPSICMACSLPLQHGEECICTHCRFHLPQTKYHLDKDNPLHQYFWGKVSIHSIAAYFFFHKGEKVQKVLHRLKYEGRKEIGIKIGEWYGHDLMQSDLFNTTDLIIPVPLHLKKERKRGYNQSLLFAQGLSRSIGVEVVPNALMRIRPSETQTLKSRFSRWNNVNEIFKIDSALNLENIHVLLVDDVLTTGATLEACALELSTVKNIKISIAAMASVW